MLKINGCQLLPSDRDNPNGGHQQPLKRSLTIKCPSLGHSEEAGDPDVSPLGARHIFRVYLLLVSGSVNFEVEITTNKFTAENVSVLSLFKNVISPSILHLY